ncbi:CLUMA_CG013864, isoform A [Clunio marinus]|uniref:Hormone-sensitive lipase n=1 Tax=Clunio marinus TaxID=568069 RepID=A0A1J1IM14_9DIPT|nr:CLUMA_CG013864, isoform A [Clunio marinus]
MAEEIEDFAHEYDFDSKTPGNGYRSFIYTYTCVLNCTKKMMKRISDSKSKFFADKEEDSKEVYVCSQMIQSLFHIAMGLKEMHQAAEKGFLYGRSCHHDNIITRSARFINHECFLGRSIGFQYLDSIKFPVKVLACMIACHSVYYFTKEKHPMKVIQSLNRCKYYMSNPDACARRLFEVNKHAEINFLVSFLNFSSCWPMKCLIDIMGAHLSINREFTIPTNELEIYSEKLQKKVSIPIPSSHAAVSPILCRLLSAKKRHGMVTDNGELRGWKYECQSKYLIFHVHGGGWISQSSKTHEVYLREWAIKLDVPILSIDYTLAQVAPFPRAIEEIVYAYCWTLKNSRKLGSTGENIVFVGDSAGANLLTACLIRCIEMGVPTPKGMFNAYSIYLINLVETPARFMGFTDAFLPFGLTLKIFNLYGNARKLNGPNCCGENLSPLHYCTKEEYFDANLMFEIPRDYLLSPYWAPDEILAQFPPTKILSMITDPCIDDCVDFAKKLRGLKVNVQIDILGPLIHGFLNFVNFSEDCHEASLKCMQHVAELLGLNVKDTIDTKK